jgi:hypothetical protein
MASFPTAGSYRLLQFKVDRSRPRGRLHQGGLPVNAVSATVNGATEKARIAHDPAVVFAATVRSLVRAVLRERQ